MNRRMFPSILLLFLAFFPARAFCAGIDSFVQTNLTSDLPGVAQNTDPNLRNPWGMAFSSTSPIWVSDNKTGLSTIYNGAGQPQGLVVTIPPSGGSGPGTPTGVIFNPNSANFGGSHFIFATEDGAIAAWSSGTSAVLEVNSSGAGAVYKGLAMGNSGGNTYIYAADFHNGLISVFDSTFSPHSFGAGTFIDPTLPSGYAPFDIKNIEGQLYVTYALQDAAKHDDVAGPGNGFVDVFNTNGVFIKRLISGGSLNSPWGMAIAPTGFGSFGGKLLVGNFGDGIINVFDPTSGGLLGTLDDQNGNPITILGLWGLEVGNGAQGTSMNAIYFTAGIPGPGEIEDHGLFGDIQQTPEPSSLLLLGSGLVGALGIIRKKLAR